MALAEVWEVATFYHRFDVTDDAPDAVTIRVCESLSCAIAGADALATSLAQRFARSPSPEGGLQTAPRVRVMRGPCMGACDVAPAVEVGQAQLGRATAESVTNAVVAGNTKPEVPEYVTLDDYLQEGGYALYRDLLAGKRTADAVIAEVEASGLRGMGGAGFPAGRKWKVVRGEPAPRLMALNADEGEPGTFKDRHFLERDPHRVLEGMLIACFVVDAREAWIYLRDEYPAVREILTAELHKLREAGLLEHTQIQLRRGAGAYICGEESAMLESLEGKRGWPRNKPPYPAQVGLFGRPTLVQNVETMYWVRDILTKGASWWTALGRHGRKGLRSFSLSGRVKKPGVHIAPAGITLRELVDEYGGGMQEGHTLKAYLPGGASGGILPASLADVPLDFDTLQPHGCFIGSAAIVVLSDRDSMKDVAVNLMRFFEHESCGQCTPCRSGTGKSVALMSAGAWNAPLLKELSACMMDASICGLGQAAPNPVLSVLKHFPGEVT